MNKRARLGLALLGASLAVIGFVYALLVAFWYPPPYFRVEGADRVFYFMAAALLVLGPLLTVYLFKPGKKGLWLDMTVVALLQAAALGWALNVLYQDRPWFVVFAVDRFSVLAARDVDFTEIRDARYLQKPRRGPWMITARMPLDQQEYEALMEATMFRGEADIEQRPRYWGDYVQGRDAVVAQGSTREEVLATNPGAAQALDQALAASGLVPEQVVFVPTRGVHADFALMLDRSNGKVIDAVEIAVWF